jgi:hypothetical protein
VAGDPNHPHRIERFPLLPRGERGCLDRWLARTPQGGIAFADHIQESQPLCDLIALEFELRRVFLRDSTVGDGTGLVPYEREAQELEVARWELRPTGEPRVPMSNR